MPTRGSACAGDGDAVVNIAAEPEIEGPVFERDGVLDVQRQLLDVGVAVISYTAAGGIGTTVGGRQRSQFWSSHNRPAGEQNPGFGVSAPVHFAGLVSEGTVNGTSVGVQTGPRSTVGSTIPKVSFSVRNVCG